MEWTADVMSDPARDHRLHVELRQDGEFKARIYCDECGVLQLWVYGEGDVIIPAGWLLDIIQQFSKDLRVRVPPGECSDGTGQKRGQEPNW